MQFLCILNNDFNVIFITKYAEITVDINQRLYTDNSGGVISQIAHLNTEQ